MNDLKGGWGGGDPGNYCEHLTCWSAPIAAILDDVPNLLDFSILRLSLSLCVYQGTKSGVIPCMLSSLSPSFFSSFLL